jgi:hypothetical protein
MKFAIFTILAFVLVLVSSASLPLKSYIVTYPDGTPGSVIDQAINAIKDVGGIITHRFKLIT